MARNTGSVARVREFFARSRGEYTASELARLLHIPYKEMSAVIVNLHAVGGVRRRSGGRHAANGRTVWLYSPVRGALAASASRNPNAIAPRGFDAAALSSILGTVHRGEPPRGRMHRIGDNDSDVRPVGRPRKEARA